MTMPSLRACDAPAILILGLSLMLAPSAAAEERSDAAVGPGAAEPNSPAHWYGAGVRPTEKRSPEQERLGFHLPPGFEIELVAAEPAIAKPLNMAFDPKGRLWITQTVEYPYPASGNSPARDCVKTLEDSNGDGRFDRITTFASGLNIPIGLLPFADGVIVYSIPNLMHLRDTDGDGICDRRDLILGPFDTSRDTHGMVNALRRGDDGWIYACHGFSNQSTVAGSDGHQVSMTSGNTFRFRANGTRVELFTSGQVNPFGMAVDSWGNRFTADCHSKPITALVRGACYPSFGRPHDGLGFFPSMMDHAHGSTAISGICLYDGDQYPEAYHHQIYSGNVMTSRINRDRIERNGATFKAHEVDDFLTSDDPWFRPVDIQQGPDGAIYVADFYNRIIGHYEVPLEHPGRDRESGRIWRIRYRGDPSRPGLSEISSSPGDGELTTRFAELSHPNATCRQLALEALSDDDASAQGRVLELAVAHLTHPSGFSRSGAMWLLHRKGHLSPSVLTGLLQDSDPRVRQHALRALADRNHSDSLAKAGEMLSRVRALLDDPEALVAGAAAQALAIHGDASDAPRLIDHIKSVSTSDPMLRARFRISLRDLMARVPECLLPLGADSVSDTDRAVYLDILLGLRTASATDAILDELSRSEQSLATMLPWIDHAARQANPQQLDRLVSIARQRCEQAPGNRKAIFTRLKKATAGRTSTNLAAWAESVATGSINNIQQVIEAGAVPIHWQADSGADWGSEMRGAVDQKDRQSYRSSLTLGEQYTGTYRSDAFTAAGPIRFWLVGHNGAPGSEDVQENHVRLVDVASGQTLLRAYPPRSDVASPVRWDLKAWADRAVRIEVVDANPAKAYAWVGIGGVEPLQLSPLSDFQVQWTETLELIAEYGLDSQAETLSSLARSPRLDPYRRLQAAESFADLAGDAKARTLSRLLLEFSDQRQSMVAFLDRLSDRSHSSSEAADIADKKMIRQLADGLTQRQQLVMAQSLASNTELSLWLIEAMEDGWLSPGLLHDKSVDTAIASTLKDSHRSRLTKLQQAAAELQEDLGALRNDILKGRAARPGDVVNGQTLFQKQCAVCHQLGGQGSLVGPQLDGIGARDSERLLEDILLPDRNVDKAFRTTSFLLEDGTVQVGLIRTESDQTIELIQNDGQVRQLDASAVVSRRSSNKSLMPAGQQDTLEADGLIDLLAYLKAAASSARVP